MKKLLLILLTFLSYIQLNAQCLPKSAVEVCVGRTRNAACQYNYPGYQKIPIHGTCQYAFYDVTCQTGGPVAPYLYCKRS